MNQKELEKKTVDFSKVVINDLDGKPMDLKPLKDELCKKLYYAGGDMVSCMLGMKLWNAEGPIELNSDEEEVLRNEFKALPPYLTRTALLKALNNV